MNFEKLEISISQNFYFELSSLLKTDNYWDSILNAIFEDYIEFYEEQNGRLFSRFSYSLYKEFVIRLKVYLQNCPNSDDWKSIYLDAAWKKVLILYLIPALVSMERDFKENDIECINFRDIYNL